MIGVRDVRYTPYVVPPYYQKDTKLTSWSHAELPQRVRIRCSGRSRSSLYAQRERKSWPGSPQKGSHRVGARPRARPSRGLRGGGCGNQENQTRPKLTGVERQMRPPAATAGSHERRAPFETPRTLVTSPPPFVSLLETELDEAPGNLFTRRHAYPCGEYPYLSP